MSQRILVNFFKKSTTKYISHHISCPNHLLSDFINTMSAFIGGS